EAGAFGGGRDRAGIAGFLGEECRHSDFHLVLLPASASSCKSLTERALRPPRSKRARPTKSISNNIAELEAVRKARSSFNWARSCRRLAGRLSKKTSFFRGKDR